MKKLTTFLSKKKNNLISFIRRKFSKKNKNIKKPIRKRNRKIQKKNLYSINNKITKKLIKKIK